MQTAGRLLLPRPLGPGPWAALRHLAARPARALHTGPALLARGRARYLRAGSNRQDLSPEARLLVEKARDPDDLRWQLGPGVQPPVELDLRTEERTRAMHYEVPYRGYAAKTDNGVEVIRYYPHAGEATKPTTGEAPEPAAVLMVTVIRTLKGEPFWVKDICEQVGLGGIRTTNHEAKKIGRRAFLPNLPSVGLLLYKIKHVVDIQPITFPCGMPEDFHPDRHGFRLTSRGEFTVSGPPAETPESVAGRAHWMKIDRDDINKEARKHWDSAYGSPLGNSNYHRHTGWQYNHLKDSEFTKNQKKKWT